MWLKFGVAKLLCIYIGLTKFEENPEGSSFFCVDLTWNDPARSFGDKSFTSPHVLPVPKNISRPRDTQPGHATRSRVTRHAAGSRDTQPGHATRSRVTRHAAGSHEHTARSRDTQPGHMNTQPGHATRSQVT